MSTLAIDTYRLLAALKGTGKSANFTAEEIAGAVHVAQQGGDLLTKAEFGVRMDAFEKRMDAFEKRMDAFEKRMDAFDARMDAFVERMDAFVARLVAMEDRFDAKLEEVRADLRADIKASQTQNLLWLSGLVLASNGMVIALLARLAHVI
jgi:chaperonin cofactor prefoldin